jgi:renalase
MRAQSTESKAMQYLQDSNQISVPSDRALPRVAVIGAGMAGLTCARELGLRGYDPVVFEAADHVGGRCGSRLTRVGWFDDGAQCITGATRLASYVAQQPDELAATHPWTVPATPAEDEPKGRYRDKYEDEADVTRTLKLVGAVGVPTMRALAQAIGRPLDVRLRTPIQHVQRRGARWTLHSAAGEIDEAFQALVLAMPAPQSLPLAQQSPRLAAALREVHFRSRWVLLLGTERHVGLPGYREFHGSPIERVAAMHSKPGRVTLGPQRWFIEADECWSLQHAHDDAESVADLLLDNFRAHAGRSVVPNYLCAHHWRDAFVHRPAPAAAHAECLWDDEVQLGVCGDSVVPSGVDRVHRSGVALAQAMAHGAARRPKSGTANLFDRSVVAALETQL